MNKMRKNKKGFTLIEIIVVIVIIAILAAALTPSILGVIDRANVSADDADARTVMTAAQLARIDNPGTTALTGAEIGAVLSGNALHGKTFNIFYDATGNPIGCVCNSRSASSQGVGDTSGTPSSTTINTGAAVITSV